MKKIPGLLLSVPLLLAGCTTEVKEIVYGSNNGDYFTILDTRIYYEEYGKGMPLILLHGQMGGIKDFEKCIPELSKHYRVIGVDSPGQGRSELADSMSYPLMAEYISQVIDSLKIDSTYIMGWSDGGIVGVLLAEKRPDKVRRVIAAGANYKLEGALPPEIPLDSLRPMSLAAWEAQNKKWIEDYMKALPRDWKKLRTDIDKMTYQRHYFPDTVFRNIHIPVMYMHGDQDIVIPAHGMEMHKLTRNSQLCILPNTTHAIFSESPDLVNAVALKFFPK